MIDLNETTDLEREIASKVLERTQSLEQALAELLRSNDALKREKEAADNANRAKSHFLACMSHEIRTPMNGVLGMLEILRATELDSKQSNCLQTAYSCAEGLLRLVNDLLDYSKAEAYKLLLESIAFDLIDVTQRAAHLWSKRASDKGVLLTLSIDPRCPRWVMGDPMRLGQILNNLLSNALKFTAEGEVSLHVELIDDSAATCNLRFAVRDSGVGMSAEVVQRLFTAFMQADDSISRRYGGTGLGLAICQQLAHLMQSEIKIVSQPGFGSTFSFQLQLEKTSAPGRVTKDRITEDRSNPSCAGSSCVGVLPRSVLVVDDNETNRKVAGHILKRLGVTAQFAADGAEALALLERTNFDAVLMDCHMPVMDGFDATLEWRRREQTSGRAAVKIIAVSASAFDEDRKRCLSMGMNDFIPKPISLATIKAAFERMGALPNDSIETQPIPIETQRSFHARIDDIDAWRDFTPLPATLRVPACVRAFAPRALSNPALTDVLQRTFHRVALLP